MDEQRINKKGEERRIPLSEGPAVSLSGRSGARPARNQLTELHDSVSGCSSVRKLA